MINLHTEETDQLFRAILSLKDIDECYRFFEDLCTIKEIKDMSQRLNAAVLLSNGMNYQEVGDKGKVSSATICRIKKCLEFGTGGYQNVVERLKGEEQENG